VVVEMGFRVLVVEDDDTIAGPLVEGLGREGFAVERVDTGREALQRSPDADLVLLDLGLPDVDGKEICRRLRAGSAVPIIVITARGDEIDRVVLLELGADDYLVKPFGFRERVARMGAVWRRCSPAAGADPGAGADPAGPALGDLVMVRGARRVVVDGEEVALTPKEYDLLAFLAERPGTVRTREDIIDHVWDTNWYGPTKTLDVHIASLRRKLGRHDRVTTLRGVGYRLEAA
jgi:DNA-binding response OmpR family regulator